MSFLPPPVDPRYRDALDRQHQRGAYRSEQPVFACTAEDLAARDPDNDPACEACGCPWSKHGFDGCTTVWGPGLALEPSGKPGVEGRWTETPQRVCGCRHVDPMCPSPTAPDEEASADGER